MKKHLLLILCVALCALPLVAQEIKTEDRTDGDMISVELTVTDSHGDPLPGAAISVPDKKQKAITDQSGKVNLKIKKASNISVSYIGMVSKEVFIRKAGAQQVMLQDNEKMLDQVVITGYQRTTKRRITGSVATINAGELKGNALANTDMLMQGKIAGVDVKSVSGRPGEAAKVRIRGTNTITGYADPLWVVDGVPLQKDIPTISSSEIKAGDFNQLFANGIGGINPSNIETITVLKDASAAAIYGSRAAGGVIVITTKRGKEGKLSLNYSNNFSLTTKPYRSPNLMNAKEKLQWEQELWDEFSAEKQKVGQRFPIIGAVGMIRAGYGPYKGLKQQQQEAEIQRLASQTTDWFGVIFRNSFSQSHDLSISGGSDKSLYYLSTGYSQNKGLLRNNHYDRYGINAKWDLRPSQKVKFGINVDLSLQQSKAPSYTVNPFTYAYFANPYERPFTPDGKYAPDNTYLYMVEANGGYDLKKPDNGFNILREINETYSQAKNMSASLIATLSVQFTPKLSLEGLASYGYIHDTADNVNNKDTYAAWTDRPFDKYNDTSMRKYGSILQNSSYNTNYNLRLQLNYFNTFNEDHHISLLAGSEIRAHYAKSLYLKRYGYDPLTGNAAIPTFPEDTDADADKMQSYANIIDGLTGQSISETSFASFYASMDYVYKNRYIVSLTGRTDGSSNFGSKEQFNPTGSLGLSWNIDKEAFMQPLKPIISALSLRAAYGYTGNINRSVYPQLIMNYYNKYRVFEDNSYRMGWIKNAPNPHLRWEKTRDMKLSLEAGLFNDRLNLQVEAYDRRTRDAVTSVLIPYTTGFTEQSYNTSHILNQGLEVTLAGKIIRTKNFRLSAATNFAINRNKLLKYTATNPNIFAATNQGYPLDAVITGKPKGIDRLTGIYAFRERSDARLLTAADRINYENYAFYVGVATAPVNGGYSLSMSYKDLTCSLGGTYSIGKKIKDKINPQTDYASLSGTKNNRIPSYESDLYINFLNRTKDANQRWTPQNPITTAHPRIIDAYGDPLGLNDYMMSNTRITDATLIRDISFVKLNSVMLSYNLHSWSWLSKVGIKDANISFTMNNILTFTDYKGFDPETPGAVYPTPRTYTLGFNLNF